MRQSGAAVLQRCNRFVLATVAATLTTTVAETSCNDHCTVYSPEDYSIMHLLLLFRPPGPALAIAEEAYIFCCWASFLSFFLFLPELIDKNRLIRRPPLLHQQWAPGSTHKISTDIWPMLSPPLFTGEQNVPNFGPSFDSDRLRIAVFLNGGALSENKDKLVKDRW